MKPNVVIINPADNVAISLEDIAQGAPVSLPDSSEFLAAAAIPYSHKVALRDFASGDEILKYGEVIGRAKGPIRKGDWIHGHNIVVGDGEAAQ
jgi:hypothetical protein